MTFSRTTRRGFTLIEMLVVAGLVIALLSLAVIILPSSDDRSVARGADQLQGWLSLGKQRAIRDQAPRGYRLMTDDQGNYSLLQPIEMPDIVTLNSVNSSIQITATNVTATTPAPTTIGDCYNKSRVRITVPLDVSQSNLGDIQIGDYFSISTDDVTTHLVTSVVSASGTSSVFEIEARGLSSDPLNRAFSGIFTFFRSAQPTAGESPLRLPDRVVIDLGQSLNVPLGNDILFSRNGQVRDATGGRVVLYVRHLDNRGEPTLMTIYTRSGGIAAHPPGPAGNIYEFTQDGKDSGL